MFTNSSMSVTDGRDEDDFYAILGLKKECSTIELKNAYKKLALQCHPDRWSSSGRSKNAEEAKARFQAIQKAYSVLSDVNKRLLYDVGMFENDNEDQGMGDFLAEMSAMMRQTEAPETGKESFEELQQLFREMVEGDNQASFQVGSCSNWSFKQTGNIWGTSNRSSSGVIYDDLVDGTNFFGSGVL